MAVAAFFDLDGTLLDGNSGWLWMTNEWRQGRITSKQMLEGTLYVLAYKLGVIDMDTAMVKALETIQGLMEEEIRHRTKQWFEEHVASRFSTPARDALEEHRRMGHQLVLLTSASPYESEEVVRLLDMDAYLCTRYELQGGRFTGQPIRPLCFGAGKVYWAKKYSAEHGVDLGRSYFYTDSITDLPMLEAVGHPVVVNPDFRLRITAWRRGWPVLHWREGRPGAGSHSGNDVAEKSPTRRGDES